MKYLVFLDFDHTSMMDMAKKAKAFDAEKKERPELYPTVPFDAHLMYEGKQGFAVWDATPEQIARKVAYMLPEVKYTVVPVVDARDFLKVYMEVKK